ncbi:hypothetical protein NGRA_0515 [Nosema granulosis]|uniref:Uncharacterized protein n=1 Tax=Nosema granulosis TaxID=83296 RepID=A0A9P6H3E2_9MICR|nr:hypothetical protein NGRA_0515 [Nosema granulosis]
MIFLFFLALLFSVPNVIKNSNVIRIDSTRYLASNGSIISPEEGSLESLIFSFFEIQEESQPFAILTKDFQKMTVNEKNEVIFRPDTFFSVQQEFESQCLLKKNSKEKVCEVLDSVLDPQNVSTNEDKEDGKEEDEGAKDKEKDKDGDKKDDDKKDKDDDKKEKKDKKKKNKKKDKLTADTNVKEAEEIINLDDLKELKFDEIFEWTTNIRKEIIYKNKNKCLGRENDKLVLKDCKTGSNIDWEVLEVLDLTDEKMKDLKKKQKFTEELIKQISGKKKHHKRKKRTKTVETVDENGDKKKVKRKRETVENTEDEPPKKKNNFNNSGIPFINPLFSYPQIQDNSQQQRVPLINILPPNQLPVNVQPIESQPISNPPPSNPPTSNPPISNPPISNNPPINNSNLVSPTLSPQLLQLLAQMYPPPLQPVKQNLSSSDDTSDEENSHTDKSPQAADNPQQINPQQNNPQQMNPQQLNPYQTPHNGLFENGKTIIFNSTAPAPEPSKKEPKNSGGGLMSLLPQRNALDAASKIFS